MERDQTDESLRAERASADKVLAKRQATIKDAAQNVVLRARGDADAVLAAARDIADDVLAEAQDKADARLEHAAPSQAEPRATLIKERARADATVRGERASADERRRGEQDEEALAISKLLPLEREKTDRYLLTERARSDDALANRDDFLGMVTHDLRDLLGGIVLSAQILTADAPADEAGKKILLQTNRLQRYAARMYRLIGDLVDIASIEAGKFAVAPVADDPNALISEAADTFQAAASAKGISLQLKFDEHPLAAEFDHGRIFQVLANLITNSIKFTPSGGHIWIRSDSTAGEQRFSVSDSGPGIPSHMLESIFERFWQVGKDDRRGLGLGLYISRCIVEAHGGRIWAESKLGEGTTVHFTTPIDDGRSKVRDEV